MDNNQQLNKLFKAAKEQPVAYSYEEIKQNFLGQSSGPNTPERKRWFKYKIGIIMLGILTTIGVIAWMSYAPINKVKQDNKKDEIVVFDKVITRHQATQKQAPKVKIKAMTKREYQLLGLDMKAFELQHEIKLNEPVRPNLIQKGQTYAKLDATPYLPKLTEDEIKANNKRKKKMIKAAGKYDNKEYSYIPSGSAKLNGEVWSVQAFYMQTKEVSVLEYKTFLFDLIIQGKTEDFHIAKPNFEQWEKIAGESCKELVDTYFSDEKYNDYPINNISREGAELYCKWLTLELVKVYGNTYNDFRLPTRKEWEMAASSIGKKETYPWGTTSVTNSDSCFLTNFNFNDYMKKNNWNSVKCDQIITNWDYKTVPVYSYNPNDFGLYNLSGNVAEMVWDIPRKDLKVIKKEELTEAKKKQIREEYLSSRKAGTAGGGWMDNEEEIQIYAPDKYQGVTNGHPNIGFRVVTTFLSKQLR